MKNIVRMLVCALTFAMLLFGGCGCSGKNKETTTEAMIYDGAEAEGELDISR